MLISKIVGEYEVYTRGDLNYFKDLPEDIQEKSMIWLQANVLPRKTPLLRHSSYGFKHLLQAGIDIYMTNNQFKKAIAYSDITATSARKNSLTLSEK